MKASLNCQKVTDFFDIDTFLAEVDNNQEIRLQINKSVGNLNENISISPLLQKLYANAQSNAKRHSPQGHRHNETIKKFAGSLLCLIGSAGYDMLQANFGNGLPHISTARKVISNQIKIVEGKFYFEELRLHLEKWDAPMFINVHLDDTRIVNKVEYDEATNRFVGFVMPLKDGIPVTDTFLLESFDEIKEALESSSIGKYAHCIVVKSVKVSVPSFVLFTLCTDSKYDNTVIMKRWDYVQTNLQKLGITVVSNGADGAGPFLKAMSIKSGLFNRTHKNDILKYWTFYWMPEMYENSLSCQDIVHLLAKLRTRLLTPSNLIVMGNNVTACRAHLQQVLTSYSKGEHQLTNQILENKDKQNYESIEKLVSEGVRECLTKLQGKYETKGTIVYLWMMSCIRDAFFDKALSPIKRLSLMWEVVFFLRIWRLWLYNNGYSEADHFITQNAYICIELNSHLVVNVICNVINGHFPKESFRFWTFGSQACEQAFRLLRSMTSTFSTIVNFSLKGNILSVFVIVN